MRYVDGVVQAAGVGFVTIVLVLIAIGVLYAARSAIRRRRPAPRPGAGAAMSPTVASQQEGAVNPPVQRAPAPDPAPRIRIPIEGFGNLAKVTLTFDTGIKIHDDYITENTEIEVPDVDGWGIGDFLGETS